MNNSEQGAKLTNKGMISLLWIVVMLNMAFADILSFITPGSLQQMMTGYAGELKITQSLLFVFALLLEIPIAMIFLSRLMNRKSNRVLNLIASVITIVFIIGGGSATPHYIFFSSIEVICMLAIIIICLKWPKEQAN